MMPPFSAFEKVLHDKFGKILSPYSHAPHLRMACALECAHATVGDEWSDQPGKWPDVRSLNDADWPSDEDLTEHMTRLMRAYWHWSEWTPERQAAVIERLIVLTVQRIISQFVGAPENVMRQCRDATTSKAAADAAWCVRNAYVSQAVVLLNIGQYIDASTFIAKAALRRHDAPPVEIVDLWIEAAEVTT